MFQSTLRFVLLALTAALCWGQTFDAASIKPAEMPQPNGRGQIFFGGPTGGPGTKDPGRIHYPIMSLRTLLMNAYDVKAFQVVGPEWLDSQRFDITATMPPDTTMEQFRIMLQNLLAERFQVKLHRETKEMPVYSLVTAKGGPKLKEASAPVAPVEPAAPPQSLPDRPKMGPDGFPLLPSFENGRPGLFMMMMPGRARLVGQQSTMQDLAVRLTQQLSKTVTDNTGLTAKFDFILTFSPEGLNGPMGPLGPPPPPPPGAVGGTDGVFRPDGEAPPDLFTAVQAQLGLKLEAKKGPVALVVIDHIEKTPTEN
jgi:uncharacterized protein (TIGR03435 family)